MSRVITLVTFGDEADVDTPAGRSAQAASVRDKETSSQALYAQTHQQHRQG
jgi:hypothetical protein